MLFRKKSNEDDEHSFWISYADMLIGLLISFMVISLILYKSGKPKDIPPCPPCPECPVCPVDSVETGRLAVMAEQFKDVFKDDPTIVVTDNGTVRFRVNDNKEQLFKINDNQPTPFLQAKLKQFFPKYMDIILNEGLQNGLNIKEIRIEGHTDSTGMAERTRTQILYNYRLSSDRAAEVQKFLFYTNAFNSKDFDTKKYLFDRMISCGYGTSQPLDKDGEFARQTGNPIDINQSRRIEFRIITEASGN